MNDTAVPIEGQAWAEKRVCLFQFWDENIPASIYELTQGVAQLNTAVDYLLFDDASATEFIRAEFGADVLKLYQSCVIPAMRADLFRYCFLARHGGVYVDADFPAVACLEPLVRASEKGCLYMREKGLTNSMMFFREAGHPLMEKILDDALHNVSHRTSNSVWQVTGPRILQIIYADNNLKDLFDGIRFVDESEFSLYFKPAIDDEYKNEDSHWLIAKQKNLNIFRD